MAAAAFGVMAFLVHHQASRVPSSELAVVRAVATLAVLLPFCWRELAKLRRGRDAAFVWLRAVAGAVSIFCYFWNLQHADVGTASVFVDISPAVLALLSVRITGDFVPRRARVGAIVAVAGASLVHTSESTRPPTAATIVGVFGLAAAVIAQLSLRRAAQKYSPLLLVSCLSIVLVVIGPWLPGERWVHPSDADLAILVGIIATSIVGQLCFSASFRDLPATTASALSLLALVCAVGIEEVLDHHDVEPLEYLAYGLVVGGIIVVHVINGRAASARDVLARATLDGVAARPPDAPG